MDNLIIFGIVGTIIIICIISIIIIYRKKDKPIDNSNYTITDGIITDWEQFPAGFGTLYGPNLYIRYFYAYKVEGVEYLNYENFPINTFTTKNQPIKVKYNKYDPQESQIYLEEENEEDNKIKE